MIENIEKLRKKLFHKKFICFFVQHSNDTVPIGESYRIKHDDIKTTI